MKRRETRFTLIELLVVIGIIAVLAGILLPTISIALKKTNIAKAKTEMNSLASAIAMYQSEYDVMPYHNSGMESRELSTDEYRELIAFLSQTGVATEIAKGNPRKVKMLNVKKAGVYLDPWDNPYHIVIDTNYNDEITKADIVGFYKPTSASEATTVTYSIVIWSAGPDGTYKPNHNPFDPLDPKHSTNRDNIYTVETNWDGTRGHVIP